VDGNANELAGTKKPTGGCGIAAALYYWTGFWSLAVPVAVGTLSAILGKD